jgi:hypothetical protein
VIYLREYDLKQSMELIYVSYIHTQLEVNFIKHSLIICVGNKVSCVDFSTCGIIQAFKILQILKHLRCQICELGICNV